MHQLAFTIQVLPHLHQPQPTNAIKNKPDGV
jgi:hypothetical protein